MAGWGLLILLAVGALADWGSVSDGRHFKPCSAADCRMWCDHIPCCLAGRWNGKCWLYSRHTPSGPPCATGNESRCAFRRRPPKPVKGAPSKLNIGNDKLKICLHINQVGERGTERSTFDYGYFAKKLLGHDAVIMTSHKSVEHALPKHKSVLERFEKEFGMIRTYNNSQPWLLKHGHLGGQGLTDLVHRERCHLLYSQKGSGMGQEPSIPDALLKVPWAVHVVFEANEVHGTAYAGISTDVSNARCWNGAAVPYMVYPHETVTGGVALRAELDVPDDHLLLCRHGSTGTFDVPWVRSEIIPLLDRNPALHFLLVNTDWPSRLTHRRLHLLPAVIADVERRRYFDACDGMLHARQDGETFGLAVAEMSVHNKPVITCDVCGARQHINILGDKALLFRDTQSLSHAIQKLLLMGRSGIVKRNWNAYDRFTPARIMQDFNEVFIEPARLYWYRLKKMAIADPFRTPSDRLPPRFNYFWRGYDRSRRLSPSIATMLALQSRTC